MANSSYKSKIMDLEARLRAENEANERDQLERDVGTGFSPRHGSGRRPRQLGDIGTPTRTRRQLDLPVSNFMPPKSQDSSEIDNKMKEIMKMSGVLTIDATTYQTELKDMEHLGELGNGTCGHVVKMLHQLSQSVIAVKQMRRSGNSEENKRIIMDLDVVLKSHDCPFIVQCLGCFITEADVWICMELMATCFDKLLKRFRQPVPENILGKVTLATVKALHYLKESHGVIHRDVKPSNILLDERGNVKLCDFGISGRLVDSKAKTKNAGCAAYMAPERIDPPDPRKPDYDIRADVWSLGITLVELATGMFPYKDCKSDFEVLSKVMQEEPPTLPGDEGFTPEFQNFVKCCLTKKVRDRPKYKKLLDHAWLQRFEVEDVNVAEWYAQATSTSQNSENKTPATPTNLNTRKCTPPPPPTATPRRHVPPPPVPSNHSHQRVVSEGTANLYHHHPNGDIGTGISSPSSGRFSPFRASEPPPIAPRLNASPIPPEWDRNHNVGISSPLLTRKRYPYDSVIQTTTSPLLFNNSSINTSSNNYNSSVNGSSTNNSHHFNNNVSSSNIPSSSPNTSTVSSPLYHYQTNSYIHSSSSTPASNNSGGGSNAITSNVRSSPLHHPSQLNSHPHNIYSNHYSSSHYHNNQLPSSNYNSTSSPSPSTLSYTSSTSPLLLQRFQHQQQQYLNNSSQPNSFPQHNSHHRSTSVSPCRQYTSDGVRLDDSNGKKRFTSCVKVHLGGALPPQRTSRHSSPGPPGVLSSSPEPPPRTNRVASPLVIRRSYLESGSPLPIRRDNGSPSLSRRYISPSPPQPPPRRISECSSVPGSPQHSQRHQMLARFHTPEPQRRVWSTNNNSQQTAAAEFNNL